MASLFLLGCWWPAAGQDVPSFAEWRSTVPVDYPSCTDYLRVLSRWPKYAETDWHTTQGDPSMARYGPGDSHWGAMCHASAMFCYALLATDPGYVPWNGGPSREELLARVNQGLKLMTRCHITGDLKCTDGKPWSDPTGQWHSATWAENMGAAADMAWDHLTPENRAAVRRVLTWEAERLSAEQIPSGDFSDTKAESNAWNASVLARAAVMFSDDPRAARWREKATEWAMNTLSVPQDTHDDSVIDGRPVRAWVHTVNVHRSFASENHGYYHVCYMWWPMWCLASAHYSFASHRQTPPRGLYHHWTDLFAVLKRCYLADGRFAYVSGKDWPRYVYGLTAAVPAYVVLADELGEPAARNMEREAFRRYEWEQLHNGDGSFLSKRLAGLKASGAGGYRSYCRFEADEAIMLGLAYRLHRLKPPRRPLPEARFQQQLRGSFRCPDAGILFRSDPDRFAGWSWKTRVGRPQATVAVPGDSTLPEWDGSLCSAFEIEGVQSGPLVARRADGLTDGGFWATGVLEWGPEAPAPRTAPRWLQVVDDNVPVKSILKPEHPIFRTPNRLEDLEGLVDADSITAAAPEWTVLAENLRGGPSVLETRPGQGCIVVCMNTTDSDHAEGKPGGRLFQNLVAYVRSAGPRRVGYLSHQGSARRALETLGIDFVPIPSLASEDLARYGAIVADRGSSADLQANAWRLVEWVQGGGRLLRFCLQDTEWQEDQLSGRRRRGALTHAIGVVALPDGRTTVVGERVVANRRLVLKSARGLNWHVGNDLYNGNRRTLHTDAGAETVPGVGGGAGERLLAGRWVNVDSLVGVATLSDAQLVLADRATRTAPFQSYGFETLGLAIPAGPRQAGDTVLDHITSLYTQADQGLTRRLARGMARFPAEPPDVLAAAVPSPAGGRYLVAWNFGEAPAVLRAETATAVPAGTAVVRRLEG